MHFIGNIQREKETRMTSRSRSENIEVPLETNIFILNFSIPACSEQLSGSHANEIKHDRSPVVIVILDPRYDLSYKTLYIYSRSIALTSL